MEEHIMKKNLWILGGLVAMAFTACTNDDVLPADNTLASGKKVLVTAYAPGDGADSRIAFNDNEGTISLSWDTEESFSVIRGGENQTFSKNGEGNAFEGNLPTNGEGTYYAVYPTNDATDYTAVPYDLSVQTGVMNSNSTYMYASTEITGTDANFQFQHTTAVLKATFSNTDWTADTKIKEVKVLLPEGKAKGTIDLNGGALTGTDGYNLITINYATPVAATTAAYIYLPPMAKDNKALTFVVTATDGKKYTATLAGANDKDIEAGMVYTANVSLSEMNYLMFVADGDGQSLQMSRMVPGLKYSTDGIDWYDLGTGVAWFANKMLFLRGTAENGTNGATIKFNNGIRVACSGDIRTLMNYENYSDIQTSGNFKELFKGCTSLTTAPELPATTLADFCYRRMFSGCTSLTTAPELPATTLDMYCYENMFKDCTKLINAPALPATTLSSYCYKEMFYGCTSLTTAPALPATTLIRYCYGSMFKGCTSLTDAPALPATTLAGECYEYMFQGCTSLTTAPALPATTLANYCYRSMFSGCTSLTTAPALPAATLANYCYCEMFKDCTKLSSVTMFATDISAENCLKNWLEGAGTNASNRTIRVANGGMVNPVDNVTPDNWVIQNYM